jgi:hypothetical protein
MATYRFGGIFQGENFAGKFVGRCGNIRCEAGFSALDVYWELGAKGVLIGPIPCEWKEPPGVRLETACQFEIYQQLKEWLRSTGVPSDLADAKWQVLADDPPFRCAWNNCGNYRVSEYTICRDHLEAGYLSSILASQRA